VLAVLVGVLIGQLWDSTLLAGRVIYNPIGQAERPKGKRAKLRVLIAKYNLKEKLSDTNVTNEVITVTSLPAARAHLLKYEKRNNKILKGIVKLWLGEGEI